MKVSSVDSISPELMRMIILAAGAAIAFFVYSGIDKKKSDLMYTEIYGSNMGADTTVVTTQSQDALPIVIARSKSSTKSHVAFSDELIAGAFNPRKKVVVVVEEDTQEPVVKVLQLVSIIHRPQVSGQTNSGVFINGTHYLPGELLPNLAVNVDGEAKTPKLTRITKDQVTIVYRDETLQLPFEY